MSSPFSIYYYSYGKKIMIFQDEKNLVTVNILIATSSI